jgi:hypothetical protein
MVDYIGALKRPFSDLDKALVGIVLSIIPIVNLMVLGYALVASKDNKKLPEWKNIGDLFIKGIIAMVIGVLLFLPAIALISVGTVTLLLSPSLMPIMESVYSTVWNSALSGGQFNTAMAQIIYGNWNLISSLFVLVAPFFVIAGLVALMAGYVMPMALLEWINTKKAGSAFSGKVLRKAFTGEYLVNWFVVMVLSVIIGFFLGFIPFLGAGLTLYVTQVFSYTVLGEVYRKL